MGVGGYVSCNCFKEGKISPPPIDASLLEGDGEGHYFFGPAVTQLPDEERTRLWEVLRHWKETCCEHKNMELIDLSCGWAVLRAFQQALEQLGEERFPTILAVLPDGNDCGIPAIDAHKVLMELDEFDKQIGSLRNHFLLDVEAGREIYDYIAGYEGQFVWGGERSVGFDPRGLWIRNDRTGEELFRCMRCTQEKIETSEGAARFVIRDPDSGASFELDSPICGSDDRVPPELTVIERALTPKDVVFASHMRQLLYVSLASRNPVQWC